MVFVHKMHFGFVGLNFSEYLRWQQVVQLVDMSTNCW